MTIWDHIVSFLRRLFGLVPEPEPMEPEPEKPLEPVEPVEPTPIPPDPYARVLWPDEWAVSGAWAIHDGYVEALEVGDGDVIDTTTVDLPSGVLTVTARLWAPDKNSDAFYVVLDGFATRLYPSVWGAWTTVDLPLGVTEAGVHTVGIGTGEPGLIIDAIAITSADWTDGLDELLGSPPELPAVEEPVEPEEPDDEPEPEPEPPVEPADPGPLTPDAKLWRDRLIAYTDHVKAGRDHQDLLKMAREANTYNLGRHVYMGVDGLTLAYELAKDARFLDAADVVLQTARAELKPGWRGVEDAKPDSRSPGGNGYVEPGSFEAGIWVWKTKGQKVYTGRNVHLTDSPRTAAMVAHYALTAQEAGGYEERVEFWTAYLVAWERVWRSNNWRRKGKPWPELPIFARSGTHSVHNEMRLYVTLAKLTGDDAYLQGANYIHDRFWAEVHEVDTPVGPGLVWERALNAFANHNEHYLHPATYVRKVYEDGLFLNRVGYGNYGPDTMRRFANTIAGFMLDQGPIAEKAWDSRWLTSDMGGGVSRAGIVSDPSWSRMNILNYAAYSLMPVYEVWDASGRIREFNDAVYATLGYGSSPKGSAIPLARLKAALA